MEAQSLRTLCRYLDYGRRVRSQQGIEELYPWISRILMDDGQVYSLEEQALAFEMGACEQLAKQWSPLPQVEAQPIIISSPVDRLFLYRLMLRPGCPPGLGAAFFQLLSRHYRKYATWIQERAASRSVAGAEAEGGRGLLLAGFLQQLDAAQPLPVVVEGQEKRLDREVAQLEEENQQRLAEVEMLRGDLEFAEDRANRAHQRLKQLDEETQGLRKQLREARENGEKLRSERRNRIKSERQSTEAQRELENLKREYIKLDRRLQQMAHRLAQTEGNQPQRGVRIGLDSLRQLEAGLVLGIEGAVTAEELSRIRRRFAAAFHPDRVNQLPVWVRNLCEEVLAVVNEACDRMGK